MQAIDIEQGRQPVVLAFRKHIKDTIEQIRESSDDNNKSIKLILFFIECLEKRLSLLKSECERYGRTKAFSTMEPLWDKLMFAEVLLFSVNVIASNLQQALQDGGHKYQCKMFDDISVCVSIIPTMDFSKAKEFFVKYNYNGYLDFLSDKMDDMNFMIGKSDFAHWIYFTNGKEWKVDLSFLPSRNLLVTQGPKTLHIFARDLMTEAEKAKMRI